MDTIDHYLNSPVRCRLCRIDHITRVNSFPIHYPKLFEEFNVVDNPSVDPFTVHVRDNSQLINWRCSRHSTCEDHFWSATIAQRTVDFNGRYDPHLESKMHINGCPYCLHIRHCRCIPFPISHPELLHEFDSKGVDPYKLGIDSDVKIVWRCQSHLTCRYHTWATTVRERLAGMNCPWCYGFRSCPCLYSGVPVFKHCKPCNRLHELSVTCSAISENLAEMACMEILSRLELPYIVHREFPELRDPTGRLKLFFSFEVFLTTSGPATSVAEYLSLDAERILICLDGNEHFIPHSTDIRIGDMIKDWFCYSRRRHLLRIGQSEWPQLFKHLRTLPLFKGNGKPINIRYGAEYAKSDNNPLISSDDEPEK